MSASEDMATRHSLQLTRFAELAMELAEDLQVQALNAETPADKAALAQTFHTLGRTLRQTLALEDRLFRTRQRADRKAEVRTEREASARVHDHKTQVRLNVDRLIWTEAEGQEAENLSSDLEDVLDLAAYDEQFLETTVQQHIANACRELGISPPPLGEVSAKPTEGVLPVDAASRTSQPRMTPSVASGDSSPKRGATEEDDHADDDWRSSA